MPNIRTVGFTASKKRLENKLKGLSKQNKIISDVEHNALGLLDLLGTKKKKLTAQNRDDGVKSETN